MTNVSWNAQTNGNWDNAWQWSTGTVPGSDDDVTLPGNNYFVDVTTAIVVHSVAISGATLDIDAPGKSAVIHGDLANDGVLKIDTSGSGGSTVTVDGTLTNDSSLDIGSASSTADTRMTVGHLVTTANDEETGRLTLTGGAGRTTLDVLGTAPSTLHEFISVTGNSLLHFGSGGVETIGRDAGIGVTGRSAHIATSADSTTNSALSDLARNNGYIELENGAAIASVTDFLNAGRINLGLQGKLTVASLDNTGTINIAKHASLAVNGLVTNDGFIDLSYDATLRTTGSFVNRGGILINDHGGSIKVSGTLTNSGQIGLDTKHNHRVITLSVGDLDNTGLIGLAGTGGQIRMIDHAAAPTTLTGTYTISGKVLFEFAGRGIQTITTGSELAVYGADALLATSSDTSTESALRSLETNDGTLILSQTKNVDLRRFYNAGTTNLLETSMKVDGTFRNHGRFTIGATAKTRVVTSATVGRLLNIGTIVIGSPVSALANLTVLSAAPTVLTIGTYQLTNEAVLDFASGGIQEIGKHATLSIDGAGAVVAVGSDTSSNSALKSLTSNAGTLTLSDDARVAISASFSNAGTLTLSDDASVIVAGTFSNTGSIVLSRGTRKGGPSLALKGAAEDAGSIIVGNGAVLALSDTLTVTGSLSLAGGTISGGTLGGSGTIQIGWGESGTLDGVTIAADAILVVGPDVSLKIGPGGVEGAIEGDGTGALAYASAGIKDVSGISGFDSINLASDGANTLTLTANNFAPGQTMISVRDGGHGNTVDASALAAGQAVEITAGAGSDKLIGGAGDDTFRAVTRTTMTGGDGADTFVLKAPGDTSDQITDFVHGTDRIVVTDSSFDLAIDEGHGTSTPHAFGPSLLSSHTDGTFANGSNRFAYDSATGALYYDAHGNAAGSTKLTIATLTNHPTLTVGDLFFIA